MEVDRGEAEQRVRELVANHTNGSDLKLSALVSAAQHYRRATVCDPFPGELFGRTLATRDFEGLRSCLAALPSMAALAHGQQLGRLSSQQLLLLHWLLTEPRRPVAHITRASLEDVRRSLPSLKGWVQDVVHNPSLRPQCILALQPPDKLGTAGKVLAFHGTHMENLHAILHHGLRVGSGTRLERTGAAFGKGIYFSTELTVAFAFCHPGPTWAGSTLGSRQRCLFVCGIDREHAKLDGDSTAPDKYIILEQEDAVSLYYAFLYADHHPSAAALAAADAQAGGGAGAQPPGAAAAAGPAGGAPGAAAQLWWWQRVGPLTLLVGAYLLWLLYVGLRDNWPLVRRLARRHLGWRLP